MQRDEVVGIGRLVGVVAGATAARVAETHGAVAGRVFRAVGPVAAPVRVVHDGLTRAVYAGVRGSLRGGGHAAGLLAARGADGTPLDASPRARVALAILNGAHGDLVDRQAPGLALAMTLRAGGRDVTLPEAAGDAPTGRVAVFLHGLTETEASWCWGSVKHQGRPGVTYGDLLRRDLAYTPVFVRYNTGLRVSANGAGLAGLLDEVVRDWPVPVEELLLVGHSMGGLVARSALHQGVLAGAAWPSVVRDTVTLGSPHLGAPLERTVGRLTTLLRRLPETAPIAAVLDARSVGIKDLRHGNLVEDDWRDHDPSVLTDTRTHVPLHDGARHFVVLATLARDPASRAADLVGDLLVTPRSATGDSGDERAWALPADRVLRLGGLHHFDLLHHPRVYAQLRAWLEARD